MRVKVLLLLFFCTLFACSEKDEEEIHYSYSQFLLEKELILSPHGDSVIVKTRNNAFWSIRAVTTIHTNDTVRFSYEQPEGYNWLQTISGDWYTIRTMPESGNSANSCYIAPSFFSVVLTPNRTGSQRKLWILAAYFNYLNNLEVIQESE